MIRWNNACSLPQNKIMPQEIEWLGIAAVTIMVVSYGLESRGRVYVCIFAIGCLLAAFYAYLIQSYPFLIAETIWSFIAFKRWYHLYSPGPTSN